MFTSPGEIALRIGWLKVHYYGILLALAIFVGVIVANKIQKKYYPELNNDIIYDVALPVIVGGILGARLYYCLLSLPFYLKNPTEIFAIWHGGLSIQGAILGGLLFGVIYCKKFKLPILALCDMFAIGLSLAQAIGRWGNFFNSEAFGLPTNLPWKLYIPYFARPSEYSNFEYFHPTFLYESILDLIIFGILLLIIKKVGRGYAGLTFSVYLILYSIARLFTEQIRIDSVLNVGIIPIAQIVCIMTIAIASTLIFFITKKNNS